MEEKYYLNFMDAYVDKEYLYAVSLEGNIFFRAKREDNYCIEILGSVNGFHSRVAGRICAIQYYDNSLYMFSNCTYEVARYDLSLKKIVYYYPTGYKETFDITRGICRIGNEVWILRNSFEKKLCVFCLEDYSYKFYDLDISVLSNNIDEKSLKQVGKENICLIENKVWRCIPGTNHLYSIDVITKQLEFYKVESDIEIFTMNHGENGFYLLSIYGEFVIWWDKNKGVIDKKEINYGKKEFKAFRNILHTNGCDILIPCLSDEIQLLSKKGETIGKCELPSGFRRIRNKSGLFFGYFLDNEQLLMFPLGGNGLIEINTNTLKSRYYPVSISKGEFINMLAVENQYIIENGNISLDSYTYFLNSNLFMERKLQDYEVAGSQIMKVMESKI